MSLMNNADVPLATKNEILHPIIVHIHHVDRYRHRARVRVFIEDKVTAGILPDEYFIILCPCGSIRTHGDDLDPAITVKVSACHDLSFGQHTLWPS